jgi:hypothetical protein
MNPCSLNRSTCPTAEAGQVRNRAALGTSPPAGLRGGGDATQADTIPRRTHGSAGLVVSDHGGVRAVLRAQPKPLGLPAARRAHGVALGDKLTALGCILDGGSEFTSIP